MMNLRPFRQRPTDHDAALAEAITVLADIGRTLIAETQALREQVELQRQRDERIDGRLDAVEQWLDGLRRTAPKWLGSDLTAAFTNFLSALASHYPAGRSPDAPYGGRRT